MIGFRFVCIIAYLPIFACDILRYAIEKVPVTLCPANEAYSECVIPCNDCMIKGNCRFLVCNRGCDCISGFYRNQEGICVEEKQCEKKQCPNNEEYVKCGKPCNTCSVKGNCQQKHCKEGCDCKAGYYRNDKEICIPENECPQEHECGENEEYSDCETACPKTCKNIGKEVLCSKQCNRGCFCKEGYVRSEDDRCILPEMCPVKNTCGPLETYYKCKPKCRTRCDTYFSKRLCPKPTCEPGCECIQGLVRDKDGDCVNPKNCNMSKCPAEA